MRSDSTPGLYLLTLPAGYCGDTVEEARKLQDRIISAVSRSLKKKIGYSIELLSGVSDVDLEHAIYMNVPTSRKGRPEREIIPITGHEIFAHVDPHIHILLTCFPGSSVANIIKGVVDKYLPDKVRSNLQTIYYYNWLDKKFYVIRQSRYFRVLQLGNQNQLFHHAWQFSEFGRGKKEKNMTRCPPWTP